MSKGIKADLTKSLAEQNLPSCHSCKNIEADYCKIHYKRIEDIEYTLCTEYEEKTKKPRKRTLEELGITEDKYYIAGRYKDR